MDIDLLKKIVEREGFTMKKALDGINISEAGFYRAIKTGSLRVTILEGLADALSINICEFFGGNGPVVDPNNAIYKEKYWNTLEKYNAMLEDNMELRREIQQLRNKK